MASSDGNIRAIIAAALANTGIAIAKLVGFFITGSSALLAEAIHSGADTSNQGLLALGGRRARREATALHAFGYGRARYFWSFVVAVVLFSVGGLFSIYEGYHKVADPHEITSPGVAIGILVVALAMESYALRTAIHHARPHRGRRSWARYVRESRSPELPVLLLEDSGAILGLVSALLGIVIAVLTGNPIWDGIGTLAIGVILIAIAIVLAIEMQSLLLGEAADPETLRRIEAEICGGREVRGLLHMRTQHMGPDELLVGAKVEFDRGLSMTQLAAAINACEARVRAAVPIAGFVYVEPDLPRRDGRPPEAAPAAR